MAVNVRPMPSNFRDIPAKLRPMTAPIFDSDPSPEDIAEARALFAELDAESQSWYRDGTELFDGLDTAPAASKPSKRVRSART